MKKIIHIVSCLFLINSIFVISCSNDSKLSDQQIENLVAFAKIYGYVKYFHPSSEAKEIDWNTFAIIGTREILLVKNIDESKKILLDLFSPIAPSILVYKEGDNDSIFNLNSIVPQDTTNYKQVYWKHIGDGISSGEELGDIYKSFIVNMDSIYTVPNFDSVYIGDLINASLGNGLAVKLPISLYYRETTYPEPDQTKLIRLRKKLFNENKNNFTVNENYYPIANIIIAWNVFKYFYPYLDLINEVLLKKISPQQYWDSQLIDFLQEASINRTEKEHYETLSKFVAHLDDGHGLVYKFDHKESFCPPFLAEWIEDSVVITKILDSKEKDLRIGDIITEIDSVNIYDMIKEKEEFISSATPQWEKIRCIESELFKGEYSSSINITINRNGKKFVKTLHRTNEIIPRQYMASAEIKELGNDIYYMTLMGVSIERILDKIDILSKAKGVIFDLRGYPYTDISRKSFIPLLLHLYDSTFQSSFFMKPVILKPDLPVTQYDSDGRWLLEPNPPLFKGKKIF